MFHSFLLQITLCFFKDLITAFTHHPSYRYSSFRLRTYISWRHTYCNGKNMNSQRTSLPHVHCLPSNLLISHTNRKCYCSSRMKRFQRKSLKIVAASIVYSSNNHWKSEMLGNGHVNCHTDQVLYPLLHM